MSPNLDKSNIEVKTPVQMLKIILQKDLAAFQKLRFLNAIVKTLKKIK